MSLDQDKDLKEDKRENWEIGEGQMDSKGKTPQTIPRFSPVTTFTPQPPNPPLNS